MVCLSAWLKDACIQSWGQGSSSTLRGNICNAAHVQMYTQRSACWALVVQ